MPLSSQVIEVLEELRQYTGSYPLLFPGRSDHSAAIYAEDQM